MGGARKASRDDLSPMDQELYDAAKSLNPFDVSTLDAYRQKAKEIKDKWSAPPPTPPDSSDPLIQQAANMERRRRMGGSRQQSFLTKQGASETFLTNPKTLMGGG